MNPNKMEVPELKALAYDLIISIETSQLNLRNINQLIANKLKEPEKEVKIPEKEETPKSK